MEDVEMELWLIMTTGKPFILVKYFWFLWLVGLANMGAWASSLHRVQQIYHIPKMVAVLQHLKMENDPNPKCPKWPKSTNFTH